MLKIISNTTPIITFLGLEKLNLLQELYQEIIIPLAVFEEIELGKEKPFYTDLTQFNWIKIKNVQNQEAVRYLETILDRGEAEVIVLAQEINADVIIIDERLARNYANIQNIAYTGSFGILLKAKQQGLISEIKPLLQKAQNNGIRMNERIINEILNKAGEL